MSTANIGSGSSRDSTSESERDNREPNAGDRTLLGRKALLMGMAASGLVIANAGLPPADTVRPSPLALRGYVPQWKPSTVYSLGQQVISPSNDVVSALLSHTSADTYPVDAATWELSATYGRLPSAAERMMFVTARGSDDNNGRSLKTAKSTVSAALHALGGEAGVIQLGAGNITTAATHGLSSGQEIRGAGKGLSTITYTGDAALFANATPGKRIYHAVIRDIFLVGPGARSTAVGVAANDMSNLTLADFAIRDFGVGFRQSSKVLGGAVYNHITNGSIVACGTGAEFRPAGANGSRWHGVHIDTCTVGVDIVDSNQNNFHACQFESNGTGVKVDASEPGLSDGNSFTYCRFEGNSTLAWDIVAIAVRDTQIVHPAVFGAYTYTDKGDRTSHLSSGPYQSKVKSSVSSASGSWVWERVSNAGEETPAVMMRDSATLLGTPVTLQIETENAPGYFLRGKREGVTYFDVSSADGSLRMPEGGSVELNARATDPATPPAAGVRLYAKAVGQKTALFALFPTGEAVQLAIEP